MCLLLCILEQFCLDPEILGFPGQIFISTYFSQIQPKQARKRTDCTITAYECVGRVLISPKRPVSARNLGAIFPTKFRLIQRFSRPEKRGPYQQPAPESVSSVSQRYSQALTSIFAILAEILPSIFEMQFRASKPNKPAEGKKIKIGPKYQELLTNDAGELFLLVF